MFEPRHILTYSRSRFLELRAERGRIDRGRFDRNRGSAYVYRSVPASNLRLMRRLQRTMANGERVRKPRMSPLPLIHSDPAVSGGVGAVRQGALEAFPATIRRFLGVPLPFPAALGAFWGGAKLPKGPIFSSQGRPAISGASPKPFLARPGISGAPLKPFRGRPGLSGARPKLSRGAPKPFRTRPGKGGAPPKPFQSAPKRFRGRSVNSGARPKRLRDAPIIAKSA